MEKLVVKMIELNSEHRIALHHALLEYKKRQRRSKMKKRIAVCAVVLVALIVSLVNWAKAYTYDSEFDPQTLHTYECVPVGMDGKAIVFGCEKEDSQVVMWVYKDTVVQYAIIKDGILYIYRLNKDSHYEQVEPKKVKKVMI